MSADLKPRLLREPKAGIERHATWLEIFFDLIFVVAITRLADRLSDNLTFIGLTKFIILFIPIWWTWVSHTIYAARFDNNDAIHWTLTFITMFAATIMATQVDNGLEDGANGYAIGYIIARIALLFLYFRILFTDKSLKQFSLLFIIGFSLGVSFWCISLFVSPPSKFFLWGIGYAIDFATPWVGRKRILSRFPLDSTYIPERFGSFTVILLGQAIAGVVIGLSMVNWNIGSIITSILAFIFAILIWGLYYNFIQLADYRNTLSSGQPYVYSHLPFVFSLVIIGVCVEELIMSAIRPVLYRPFNAMFCGAVIIWLTSFFLIKYIAYPNFGIIYPYMGGALAVLILFSLSSSPLIVMPGLVLIFLCLYLLQRSLYAGAKLKN